MAYKKTTWATGDVITADKMNNIEEGIASVTGADSPNTKDIRDYFDTSMSQKGQKHITLRPDDFSELYANGKVLMPGSDDSIAVEMINSAWKIYKYELGRAFVLRADQIVKNDSAAGCVPIAFRYKGVNYAVDYNRSGQYYLADTVLVSYNATNEAYAIEKFSFTETIRQEFSDSIICRDHAGEFDSLVVFGDSIFANTISNPDTGALTNNGNGVTKQLADLMGVPLYKHAVNNATLSTKYTAEAQNVVKQIQDYIASPDGGTTPLFIIEGGTNDAYHYGVSNLGTYGSSDTTTIYGAIYYAINLLLSIEGVQPWQILVCTPIPKGIRALWDGTTSFSSAGWLANTDLELTTIGHAMYEIALNRQCSVINGYNAIFDELSSQYICQLMMGDDTHPTVYGSERYARYIYDTLFSGASTKEVENEISELKSAVDSNYEGTENGVYYIPVTSESGYIDNNGVPQANANWTRSEPIDLTVNNVRYLLSEGSVDTIVAYYDSNNDFISRVTPSVNGLYNLTPVDTACYVIVCSKTQTYPFVRIGIENTVQGLETKESDSRTGINELTSGEITFVPNWEIGYIANDGTNLHLNNYFRSEYIPSDNLDYLLNKSNSDLACNVFVYDSSKTFRAKFSVTVAANDKAKINKNNVTGGFVRITVLRNRKDDLRILCTSFWASASVLNKDMADISGLVASLGKKCIHHDNFNRTESDWDIGKNNTTASNDNSYVNVTGETDDGVRVNNGLTIAKNTGRTNAYTFRRVYAQHSNSFMVEFSVPAVSNRVLIGYDVESYQTFKAIYFHNTNGRFDFGNLVRSKNADISLETKNIYNYVGEVCQIYFIGNVASIFVDERYCTSFTLSSVGNYVCIGAYKSLDMAISFLNVFDVITPTVYNTAYTIDANNSTLPNSIVQANNDRYSLDATLTRFSNRAEKFELESTDKKISNGRRTERSFSGLIGYNLRDLRCEFDVYFPSSVRDDTGSLTYADIFFQLHDTISRSKVPFSVFVMGGGLYVEQYSSDVAEGDILVPQTEEYKMCDIVKDKWLHFDIFLKERYNENQHPFLEIKINGEVVYQSRKPNCANDLVGSYPKYGEYKNNWDLITHSERYIDNVVFTY